MKSHPEIKTELLTKLYNSSKSLPEISEEVGITEQAIWQRLRMSGIKLRNHKEATILAFKNGRLKVQKGLNHHSWKGGRFKDRNGYIYINNGRKSEHRVVWEKANGKIPKGHIIHHLNGIRDDNRLENLCSLPRKRHSPITIIEPHQERIRELEKQLKKENLN
jgi:hypothetical protein